MCPPIAPRADNLKAAIGQPTRENDRLTDLLQIVFVMRESKPKRPVARIDAEWHTQRVDRNPGEPGRDRGKGRQTVRVKDGQNLEEIALI
mgnify:FL=1